MKKLLLVGVFICEQTIKLFASLLAIFCIMAIAHAKSFTTENVAKEFFKNEYANNNCLVDNFGLIERDKIIYKKVNDVLNGFGSINLGVFDKGECLSLKNFNEEKDLFITHFTQNNTSILGIKFNLFLAYNYKKDTTSMVLIDEDDNSFFIGDGGDGLKKDLFNFVKDSSYSYKINFDSKMNHQDFVKIADFKNLNPTSSKEFVDAVLQQGFKNENCKVGNWDLVKNDNRLSGKINNYLKDFGDISINDFDMGECLDPNSISNSSVLITKFWQKNKQSHGNNLDLYIVDNTLNNEVLLIIVDGDDDKYYLGDKSQYLLERLSQNESSKDILKDLSFDTGKSFEFLNNKLINKNRQIAEENKHLQALNSWDISCNVDRFEGTKICSLNKRNGDIMVAIINGNYSVYIGRKHYPNTSSAIKIDDNQPIYGREGISQNPKLAIEQMKKGKIAYTRYKEWPYEYNKDNQSDLTGFTIKWNELLSRYLNL